MKVYNILMEKVLDIFSPAWLKARVAWSNKRNKNNLKNCAVSEKITILSELEKLSKELYKKFEYTYDGPDEMFDSMRFPAQCYKDLKSKLKDDCDGYHAAMYHIADHNGYNCFLLTYMCKDVTKSHTVLVIKKNNRWYKLDYDRLTSNSALKGLMTRKDIIAYNLVKFDYKKSKWHIVKETD